MKICGYRTIKLLGQGAYGDVFLAGSDDGRQFAVKLIKNMKDQDKINLDREVEILRSLDHYALLRFHAYHESREGNPPAIVTEFMSGGSLEQFLNLKKKNRFHDRWDLTQKYIVAYGIASGMRSLHRSKILHRDLKPENVLLNESLEPKIADFGLSKFVESGDAIQQSGSRGTPLYLAPESINGEEYGFPVDVYSFGVMFNAILSGRVPFEELKLTETFAIYQKVTSGDRPPLAPQLPEKWQDLIAACWSSSAADRPPFEDILIAMSDVEFIGESVNLPRLVEYQKKVVESELWCDETSSPKLADVPNSSGKDSEGEIRPRKEVADEKEATTPLKSVDPGEHKESQFVLRSEYESLRGECRSLRAECESLRAAWRGCQGESQSLRAECQGLQEQLRSLREEFSALRSQLKP